MNKCQLFKVKRQILYMGKNKFSDVKILLLWKITVEFQNQ